jgi:hypothetical protein
LLGERASIGPIPAEQLLPWVAIGGVSFFPVQNAPGRVFHGLVADLVLAEWHLVVTHRA